MLLSFPAFSYRFRKSAFSMLVAVHNSTPPVGDGGAVYVLSAGDGPPETVSFS